ncbi:MAG: methionine biosynthesis protein MetW [candidate division WOR-3 bacterium]|jgi:methionine biosynthesis protein MetW
MLRYIREIEFQTICDYIKAGSSVLDLGCGDCELLYRLVKNKNIKAQGIEIDEKKIYKCVEKGVSVLHEDIDYGLSEYKDKSFDYIVLQQSLSEVVKKPDRVIQDALRVGKKVIISFSNFAHFRARLQIFLKGKTPVTPSLPYAWYNTPNLHFLSLSDFIEYCRERKIKIEKRTYLGTKRKTYLLPNFLALVGIFMISKE